MSRAVITRSDVTYIIRVELPAVKRGCKQPEPARFQALSC
jgi:hypothetical protein